MSLGETVSFGFIAAFILGTGLWAVTAKRTFHSVLALGGVLVSVAALFIFLGHPLLGILQILVYVGGVLTLWVFAVMFVAGDEDEETGPEAGRPLASPIQWTIGSLIGATALYVLWTRLPDPWGWLRDSLSLSGWLEILLALALSGILTVLLIVVAILAHIGIVYLLSQRRRVIAGVAVAGTLFVVIAVALWQTEPWQAEPAGGGEDLDALVDAIFDSYVIPFEALGILLTAAMIGALVLARPLVGDPDRRNYPRPTDAQLTATQQVSNLDWKPPRTAPVGSLQPLVGQESGVGEAGAAATSSAGSETPADGGEEE